MKTMKSNDRILGIDIIRCCAILFVIGIHTMGLLGMGGRLMVAPIELLTVSIYKLTWICVPLFLMLTGYLNYKKEASKKYFVSVLKTYLLFLLYSFIVIAFRILYQGETMTLFGILKVLANYTAQDRNWYMNMYFGLVIIIPFLNSAWKTYGKKQKIIIISVLYLITSISSYVQFLSRELLDFEIIIISSYWGGLYYIVYYFIGAFISEYKVKINKRIVFGLLSLVLILQSFLYYVLGHGATYNEVIINKFFWYYNPIVYIEATLFFLLFYDATIKNKAVRTVISEISLSAFGMYLFSVITDTICIKYFSQMLGNKPYLIVVAMMWTSSFVLSFISASIIRKTIDAFLRRKKKLERK